ncbi:MAG: hypothetical protein WAW77_14555 [Caldibacillus thermoamylovorans]
MKKGLALIGGLALLGSTFFGINIENTKASSEVTNQYQVNDGYTILTNEDIKTLEAFFNQYNVDKKTQVSLIKKLKNGEKWDSLKNDTLPVLENTVELEDGTKENVRVFEDGSIAVSSVDLSDATITNITPTKRNIGPLAVTPGTVTSGTGYSIYSKAKVHQSTGVISAHFYADFVLVQNGMDYISRVYNEKVTILGGNLSEVNLKIVKSKETLDYKAEAKLSFVVNSTQWTGANCYLKLLVGKDTYSSPYSF